MEFIYGYDYIGIMGSFIVSLVGEDITVDAWSTRRHVFINFLAEDLFPKKNSIGRKAIYTTLCVAYWSMIIYFLFLPGRS
jgi:hypothetical protein